MTEKNNDAIVVHLSTEKRVLAERIAEHRGFKNKSEYGRYLIEQDIAKTRADFEFMKSIFEDD